MQIKPEHVLRCARVEAHAAREEHLVQQAYVGTLLRLGLLLYLLLVLLDDGALAAGRRVVLPLRLRLLQVVHHFL